MIQQQKIFFICGALIIASPILGKNLHSTAVLPAAPAKTTTAPGSTLYVQTAKQATFSEVKDGVYTIQLSGYDPKVVYFSDEPARNTGRVAVQNFLATWQKVTQQQLHFSPNVAIEAMQKQGQELGSSEVSYVFALSQPYFDSNTNTINFTGQLLSHVTLPKEMTLYDLTLFIDNIPGPYPFIQ